MNNKHDDGPAIPTETYAAIAERLGVEKCPTLRRWESRWVMCERMTPAQLVALAYLCEIHPKRRPDLCHWDHATGVVFDVALPDPTDPEADPREVDGVYFAHLWHKLLVCADDVSIYPLNGEIEAEVDYEGFCCQYPGNSATLALLRAAQAARVPEIVKIMGGGK